MTSSGDTPRITVIVPARDEAAVLLETLGRIGTQKISVPFRMLVVDSGSVDGTPEIARASGAEVISIPAAEFSHGRTRQVAAEACGSELVVFTVADAVPADKNWLSELVKPLQDPSVAGSWGVQLVPPGTIGEPLAWSVSAGQEAISDRIVNFVSVAEWDSLPPREKRMAANFDNCTSCIRRSLLVDGFPFPDVSYGEDMFWAASVLRAGHGIARAARARVFHMHRESFRYLMRRMMVDAWLCADRFGYKPVPGTLHLAAGWLFTLYKVFKIDLIKGFGIPFYRPDSRLYWFCVDLWRQTGSLLGKHLGSMGRPENVPRWRIARRALARRVQIAVATCRPMHRKDFE